MMSKQNKLGVRIGQFFFLLILSLPMFSAWAEPDESTGDSLELWAWNTPENTTWLYILLSIIVCFILGVALYRSLLKPQVMKGIHPQIFFWTITDIMIGLWLLATFYLVFAASGIGLGYFAILFGIYLFLLLIKLLMRRVLIWTLFFLVLMVGLIVFYLIDQNII